MSTEMLVTYPGTSTAGCAIPFLWPRRRRHTKVNFASFDFP